MADHGALIAKLRAWSERDGSFHGDRQLADEVLIADGWRCETDQTFEGGVRWEYGIGPVVCASETTRPHPINDLDRAIAVVPFRCNWRLTFIAGQTVAHVWAPGEIFRDEFEGHSERPSVAILIAAFRYKETHDG